MGGIAMLHWALTFLVIALIAGLLGFTGVAGAASHIAQVLFVVFHCLTSNVCVRSVRPPELVSMTFVPNAGSAV